MVRGKWYDGDTLRRSRGISGDGPEGGQRVRGCRWCRAVDENGKFPDGRLTRATNEVASLLELDCSEDDETDEWVPEWDGGAFCKLPDMMVHIVYLLAT